MLSNEKWDAILRIRDDEPFHQVIERRKALGYVLDTLAHCPDGPVNETDSAESVRERIRNLRSEAREARLMVLQLHCETALRESD